MFPVGTRVRLSADAVVRLLLNPNVKERTGTIASERTSSTGQPTKYTVRLDNGETEDVYEHEIERV